MTKTNEMIFHCIKVFSTSFLSKERNSWQHLKLFFLKNPNKFFNKKKMVRVTPIYLSKLF